MVHSEVQTELLHINVLCIFDVADSFMVHSTSVLCIIRTSDDVLADLPVALEHLFHIRTSACKDTYY